MSCAASSLCRRLCRQTVLFAELAARIMAVLNRFNSAMAAAQTVLTFGDRRST